MTIKDDDRPTSLTVWFDVVKATVVEGGTTTIKVELSDDPEREIVIPITLAGLGGAIADDYSDLPSSVTFGADRCYYPTNEEYTCYEDTKRIRFMAVQDSDDDDGEAVRLGFGSPLPTGVSVGSAGDADDNDHRRRQSLRGVGPSRRGGQRAPLGRGREQHQPGVAVAAFGHRVRRLQRHTRVGGGHVEPVHSLGGRPGHVAQGEGHL